MVWSRATRSPTPSGPMTPEGLMLASEAKTLIGHRVLLWVILEPWANNPDKKTRVVLHLMDLGEDSHFDADSQSIAA